MKIDLFVYGTLRKGLRLHHHLRGAVYTHDARTRGRLYDIGTYPGLLIDSSADWVTGEVFEVDEQLVSLLDQVEGYKPDSSVHSEYLRREISVYNFHHKELKVTTYIYNRPVLGLSLIGSGDYKKYLDNQSSHF